jgi:hypothetical protein
MKQVLANTREKHCGLSSQLQISKVGHCAGCPNELLYSAIYMKTCLLELAHPSFVCPFHLQLL